MKYIAVIIMLFFYASSSLAAISAINGTISDSESIIILGSSFGENNLDYSEISTVIEETTAGQTPINTGGWIFDEGFNANPVASTIYAHSGGKSLYCNSDAGSTSALRFDYGSYITLNQTVFVSWWTRASWSVGGQWKQFRINYQNDIQDDTPQMAMFNWTTSTKQWINRPGPTTSSDGTDNYMSQVMTSDRDEWYRVDLILTISSANGTYDGSYTMYRYDPNDQFYSAINSDVMTHNDDPKYWRWFLWQNYQGNSMDGLQVYIDDPFIQVGSQARVELCDASTWAARTSCDIQPATEWSTTSITATVNTGAFSTDDTAYLYVVDADGNVNSTGYEVTIGETGGGEDTTAPTVDSFTIPATSSSLTVPVLAFTCSDDTAVTGYCISLTDDSSGCSWYGSAPSTVTFDSAGSQTAYAFCRDAALNVSDSVSDSVAITLSSSPAKIVGELSGSFQ